MGEFNNQIAPRVLQTGVSQLWEIIYVFASTPTQVFSHEYCKTSINRFLYRTPLVAASGLIVNLNKNKKKLLLYFDNSHTKQILTKRYGFFHTLPTSVKTERRLIKGKCCFKYI